MNRSNDPLDGRGRMAQPWPSDVLPPDAGRGWPGGTAVFLLGVLTLVTFGALATILATLLLPLLAGMVSLPGGEGLAEAAANAFRWLTGLWFGEAG